MFCVPYVCKCVLFWQAVQQIGVIMMVLWLFYFFHLLSWRRWTFVTQSMLGLQLLALIIQRWLKYFTLCNNQNKPNFFSQQGASVEISIWININWKWRDWEGKPFVPLFIDMNPMAGIVSAWVYALIKGNWPQMFCFYFFSQLVSVTLMAPYLRSAVRRLASAGAKKMWLDESVIIAW